MGDPRRLRKKYTTPGHPWEKQRIETENKLKQDYGLKNKKEIWKAETAVRKYRHLARGLVGITSGDRQAKETVLINKLKKTGLLPQDGSIDDVLSLKSEDLLERRLQTLVLKQGLATTTDQSRQFITHGHIALDGRKVTSPSMIIKVEETGKLGWYGKPIEFHRKETTVPTEGSKTIRRIDKETQKAGIELEKTAAEEILAEANETAE
ncbi:MAG: 30S ribosomal protein S4 [DPANN group archaeon]|nr:30S ribosomal protein S4 [DPANN group archaeon]